MINLYCPKRLQTFIDFLQHQYWSNDPDRPNVDLALLPDSDAVEDQDGNSGFAVYLVEENIILLPTQIPTEIVEVYKAEGEEDYELYFTFRNLAHEYKHYLQFGDTKFNKIDYSDLNEDKLETEADRFADAVVEEFKEWEKRQKAPEVIKSWGYGKCENPDS